MGVMAIVVGVLLLSPAVADAADNSATARLTQGVDLLPGSARAMSVEVTNTGSPLFGEGIDYVNVILPSSAGITTTPTVQAPSGWTAEVTDAGTLQTVKFRAGAGSTVAEPSIAPGASLTFNLPVNVAAPTSTDRAGTVRVSVSTDGGQTTGQATGDLGTVVHALEIVGLGASSPTGVADQSATGGQSITYGVRVRNHALQSISVTPSLASNNASDGLGAAASAAVSSGGEQTFSFPVTLGAATVQRTSQFTAGTTATGATAVTKTADLVVQVPTKLVPDANTFAPKFVRSNAPIGYDFAVNGSKTGAPSLVLTDCTLEFANTSVGLARPVDFAAANPAQLAFDRSTVTGAEGRHDARIQCQGVDGNGKVEQFDSTLTQILTIDNTVPGINVQLGVPSGQDAVKTGDDLTVTGTLSESAATLDYLQLRTDRGQVIPCPSPTRSSDGTTFSCKVKPTFDAGTAQVVAEAQATDRSGNVGGNTSGTVVVDLQAPRLVFGQTQSSSQILVQFEENRVLAGGCNPSQWQGGHLVTGVRFSDGTDCTSPTKPAGQRGPVGAPDNYRILVLSTALDRDETPKVTYSPQAASDNARDGAANNAAAATIQTIAGILPVAPDITAVTRTDAAAGTGREPATQDGAGTKPGTLTYWTNVAGNDLRVGFAGSRSGYQVQVVDGSGANLGTPAPVTGTSGEVAVPIGTADGRVVRGIRLMNAAGAGPISYFDVVLDRVAPAISNATLAGNKVTVTFSDVLAFGSNFANDWYAFNNPGPEWYQPERVDGSGNARILTVPSVDGAFGGVQFRFTSPGTGARRYEDRAGNLLPDATWRSL